MAYSDTMPDAVINMIPLKNYGVITDMGFQKLLLPLSAVVLLSACSGTVSGVGKDVSSTGKDVQKLNSASVPTGYAGQGKPRVFKPQAFEAVTTDGRKPIASISSIESNPIDSPYVESLPAPVSNDNGLQWNELGDYNGTLPATNSFAVPSSSGDTIGYDLAPIGSPEAIAYSQDVSVYSLDGDYAAPATTVYQSPTYSYIQAGGTGFNYGHVVQKFYFPHGSSVVAKKDKKKLKDIADDAKKTTGPVEITLVGHASKRVDQTADPIKKKMINFEMAQKRANAVTHELNKAGLTPDWVQTVSKGDDEPNNEPGLMSQEDADRRVELFMNSN